MVEIYNETDNESQKADKTDRSSQYSLDFALVVLDEKRFRNYKLLDPDKSKARGQLIEKINHLIDISYDNYRYRASESSTHTFCCAIEKKSKDLAGLMVLIKKNCFGAEYSEFGVSLVNETYRGYGVQTLTSREMSNYGLTLLASGLPIYSSTRLHTAQSQLQIHKVRMPNDQGKLIPVGISRGILPYYIFERDNDEFYLEFHMQYDSWMTLDQTITKTIFLPPSILLYDFQIFNPQFRPDISPRIGYPIKDQKEGILCREINPTCYLAPTIEYTSREWHDLVKYCIIIGHDESQECWKMSAHERFLYSDHDSPSEQIQSVHIESVEDFSFLEDLDDRMKSINITLQVSDFEYEINKCANLALIDLLIRTGFIPCSMQDLLLHKRRVKTVLFSLFRDIKVQSKFEIISINQQTFDIFCHDCRQQGVAWMKIINIIPTEHIQLNKPNHHFYFLDEQFVSLPKSSGINQKAKLSVPLKEFLHGAPFYHRILQAVHPYHYDLWFEMDGCEKLVLTSEFYHAFEQLIDMLEGYLAEDPGVDEFVVRINSGLNAKDLVFRFVRSDF